MSARVGRLCHPFNDIIWLLIQSMELLNAYYVYLYTNIMSWIKFRVVQALSLVSFVSQSCP